MHSKLPDAANGADANRMTGQGGKPKRETKRPLGILLAGGLMVLFGLAEVATGFRHQFFGISTSTSALLTVSGALLGAVYALAGAAILTMKRWAAILAILLLSADILGRAALVITGLYPTDSFKNTFAIIAGTLIAAFFAIYIALRLKSFEGNGRSADGVSPADPFVRTR